MEFKMSDFDEFNSLKSLSFLFSAVTFLLVTIFYKRNIYFILKTMLFTGIGASSAVWFFQLTVTLSK